MEITSSAGGALAQQQALQSSMADSKQSQASSSPIQSSTPQSSLESAPQAPSESVAIPGTSKLGGSIDTYV